MLKIDFSNFTNAKIQTKKLSNLAHFAEKELRNRKLLKIGREYLVECSFVGERDIRAINKKHRKKYKITDVISLSYFDPGEKSEGCDDFVGEIFICVPVAVHQAAELGHPLRDEIEFLFVHGLLHLFGFDHEKPQDKAQMFALTDKILCD